MKFSIITICINSEAVIRKTIDSIVAQDYVGEVEYIIIDGASEDGTVKIAEEYRKKFEEKGYEYSILSEPDKGIYDAMNKGIKKSTGNIVGIINAGDWYESIALSSVSKIYKTTQFDMFYADVNLVRENRRIITKHSKYDFFPTSRHWNHPTSFVTKKTYDDLGLYRCEGIHDDFEFWLRVRRSGKKIVIENKVLANFATGGTSNCKSIKKSIRRIKDRYRAYRINGYGPLAMLECIGIEVVKAIVS